MFFEIFYTISLIISNDRVSIFKIANFTNVNHVKSFKNSKNPTHFTDL